MSKTAARLVLILVLLGVALILPRADTSKKSQEQKAVDEIPIIPDVPKDAIPPLDFPEYETVEEATWLTGEDIVLGVSFDGDSRAYPIKILNWHEIVNERVGEQDLVITYCPLCRSGIVFDRNLEGQTLTFGNTGALYESAMVMYDRGTESYWYQVGGLALKGPFKDKRLPVLPSLLTTWDEWRSLHPETRVLSRNTGYQRNYLADPYVGYDALNSPPAFPVQQKDDRLPPKEKVVGIVVDGVAKAYPVRALAGKTVKDKVEGREIEVVGDEEGLSARVFFLEEEERKEAPVTAAFWFSWASAYPGTLIYSQ